MKKNILITILILINLSAFSQKYPIISNPNNLKITPLSYLNSNARETNLSITPDGKYLYFMSDRGGQKWSTYSGTFRGKSRFDGDIWYSQNDNGRWKKPHCLSSNINTDSGEDEPNISPDGQKVYFQSWKTGYYTNGGPYYSATLRGNTWGRPVGLGGGINDFFTDEMDKYGMYATDGMSISPDGKTFIVACGSDYDGNLDLYISKKVKGRWTYLKRMSVSTRGDERSIFIAPDGKTIYFASDAYGGMGGLDIFKANIDNKGNCTNITNIGAPFNTANDDYGFIITADGKSAFFVRDGDIYSAELQDDSPVAPGASILIAGNITDCNSNPLETHLKLVDDNGNEIDGCKSSKGGAFIFSIADQSGDYKILDSKGVVIHNFTINSTNNFQKITFDIQDCQNNNNTTANNSNTTNGSINNTNNSLTKSAAKSH